MPDSDDDQIPMLPEEHAHTAHLVTELPEDVRLKVQDIEKRGLAIPEITTVEIYQTADALLAQAGDIEKAAKAKHKELKAPILDLGRKLDDALGEILAPLVTLKSGLGSRLLTFRNQENARREAARKKAEEEAAVERARLLKIAQEKAQKEAEEAAARAKANPDDAPPPDAPAPPPAEVSVPHVYVAPVPKALGSSSVKSVPKKVVVIFDDSLIPDEVGGVKTWTRDVAAVEKLAKAGVTIPGVRIDTVDTIARKG